MSLVGLLIALLLLVLVLWVARTLLPLAKLPEPVHTVIYVIIVVIAVVWFIRQLGGGSLTL